MIFWDAVVGEVLQRKASRHAVSASGRVVVPHVLQEQLQSMEQWQLLSLGYLPGWCLEQSRAGGTVEIKGNAEIGTSEQCELLAVERSYIAAFRVTN